VSRRLPLTSHAAPEAIVAYRPGGPVTLAQFLADVRQLTACLPPGQHMLNLCQDRYRFLVGLAAGFASSRLSLLPAAHTPETVRQLGRIAPDLFCLADGDIDSHGLPLVPYPTETARPDGDETVPLIDAGRPVVCLFTSGSTGEPTPHRRSWGSVVRNARAGAERLGFLERRHAIVGTVPPQHSYGFESTVLLGLHGNGAAWSGRPFYPADVAAALAAVPRPRLLVTTPVHLKALVEADLPLPPVDRLLSATAPLSTELAQQAEARFGAPLHEIYGCTETGQLATRRTTEAPAWQLLDGVRLDLEDGGCHASGGHVEGRVPLADLIELQADGRFLLAGRHADMVNIAGKRNSIAHLNHQLNAIPQVQDGAFFLPEEEAAGGVARLAAVVVAPGLDRQALLDALRQRIDPVFLPRPLLFVDRLPRNATGKLTRDSLLALLGERTRANPTRP
jgi:acyl-coenzyme A synthetase/AMP-(fatty) acid ligase